LTRLVYRGKLQEQISTDRVNYKREVTMSLSIDMRNITEESNVATNFGSQLLRLAMKADQHNKSLLRMGFPNAVEMVEHYRETGEILDRDYD